MINKTSISIVISHLLLLALIVTILLPAEKATESYGSFLCAAALMELYYIYRLVRFPDKRDSASDIISIIWVLFLVWEIMVTKLNLCHPVLIPAPENVFHAFRTDYLEMGAGILSSMEILFLSDLHEFFFIYILRKLDIFCNIL